MLSPDGRYTIVFTVRFTTTRRFAVDRSSRAIRSGADGSAAFLCLRPSLGVVRASSLRGEINREALALFLRFGYGPAPHRFFRACANCRRYAALPSPCR